MKKFVYAFKEADGKNKALFGGKGANLAEMTRLGMPVPQGFIVTTEACTQYYADGRKINDGIMKQIEMKLADLEKITGKKFVKKTTKGGVFAKVSAAHIVQIANNKKGKGE